MLTLIKNVTVYSPSPLGICDILIANDRIEQISQNISLTLDNVVIVDGQGLTAIPGLIDNHVHILGGGGEASYASQTPPIEAGELIASGVTTVVGVLGTDGVSRTMANLVAKVRGLREQGVSAYCMAGNYRIPQLTATGDIFKDMLFVDCIIGSGELAINDHRSSQPTQQDFNSVVADTYVAGMLSGKAGVSNVHLGSGKSGLKLLTTLLTETEIPSQKILPTHINRSQDIFSQGIAYSIKFNATIDFTTSRDNITPINDPLNAHNCFISSLASGVNISNITFSSDGQGSMPIYDIDKRIIGSGVGKVASVWETISALVSQGIDLSQALLPATTNPARILSLASKGNLKVGADADIVLVRGDKIVSVFACGKHYQV
ncbi:MAG: beta-aspartyl-peptidase [Clostridia bacterium]